MEATIMKETTMPGSGLSDLNLHDFIVQSKQMDLQASIKRFAAFIRYEKQHHEITYSRQVVSPPGREVTILDPWTGRKRQMLMFASNNYLGFANHPYVKSQVAAAMDKYGAGLGGPPLLNGYTRLMKELEERLARLKHQESALIFPTGYSTNLGMVTALVKESDHVLFDEFSHASFYDAIRMARVPATAFRHNDVKDLEEKLKQLTAETKGTVFVGVEGVYSMDGDLAPLDKMVPVVKKYGAISMLDDAHGTGLLGKTGSGTAEHFGVEKEIDLSMGTFSKTFSMTGGFVAGSWEMVNYLRFFARSYVFSAALPPTTLAAVLAGIDLIEKDGAVREKLLSTTAYAASQLKKFGTLSNPEAAIIALQVPDWMEIRKANNLIHEQGIFLNAIEYPAVPEDQQRFRVSIMSDHTREDVDRLVAVIHKTWNDPAVRKSV